MTHKTLDPRPIGWFAVARSDELRPGQRHNGVLAAAPYVLCRRTDGTLAYEGSIGAAVEMNGFIFAWHHPRAESPSFRLQPLDETGFRPMLHTLLRTRSHPQEITENSVDNAHFTMIHGYSNIQVLEPMQLEGHEMRVSYGLSRGPIKASFKTHLQGIGFAHNDIQTPSLGMRTRMFVMATPTEPGHVHIRLAVSMANSMSLPLARLYLPLVHWAVHRSIVRDFTQDIAVWENKRFIERPMLVKGDGPIVAFRRFCTQFYAAPLDAIAP